MTKTQYKQTSIGLIPTDWEVKKLGEIVTYKKGFAFKNEFYSDSGRRIIRVSDTNASGIKKDGKIFINENLAKLYKDYELYSDDIVIQTVGSRPPMYDSMVGKAIKVDPDFEGSLLNQNAVLLRSDNNDFLYSNLKIQRYIDYISSLIRGNANQVSITLFDIFKYEIPLPPVPEQQKIAEILSTWDKAIQEVQLLIKKIEVRNKALAFSLLTGKKRVKGFEGKEFNKSLANEIFKNVSIKNNPEDSVLLSATQEFGMIPRDMIESRVTMPSGSLKTYKLVEKGDFVISLRSFQGGIEYSEYIGLVSPAYTVLKSINPINEDFYKFYFKSQDLIGRLSVAVIGIRDGKNISYDDFSTIILPNPSLEEQTAIAEVLNTAHQELKQYQEKLEALKLQKKGLMQQLLTGKVRTV